MPYTMDDFRKDYLKQHVNELTPQERLAGLTPEQILAGLTPEKILEGLSPEEIERMREALNARPTGRQRKPRRGK